MKKFPIFLILLSLITKRFESQPRGLICKFCESTQKSLFDLYKNHKTQLFSIIDWICKKQISSYLCDYFLYKDGFSLIDNEIAFIEKSNYLCSLYFTVCDKTFDFYDFEGFRQNLFKKYPKVNHSNTNNTKNSFSTLVINDVHLQPDYVYKGRVNCKDPSGCCSEEMPEKEEGEKAGYWGTPNSKCDIPKYFWERTLANLNKEELQTDFVLLLGDNYSHAYYRDEDSSNLIKWNNYFYDSISKNFSNSKVIPVLGNHEGDPVDTFNFEDKENTVIKNILPNFLKFIDQSKIDDYINNGFYELEYEEFGVKFVILNSQMDDILNFSLISNNTDLLNIFEKLGDSFYESEKKNHKVILLNHINFGSEGSETGYEKNMYSLLERFSDTVTTTLSGHTHFDELRFIKNTANEIIHINYISPSITTFVNYNPSFRIYNFLNGKVDDYQQYRFDIDFYNKKAEEKLFDFAFNLAYSFKDQYKLGKWESSEDFSALQLMLSENPDYQKIYLQNKQSMNFLNKDWQKESYSLKCEILGLRTDQQECFEAINGGPSIFDFLDPLYFFRRLLIKPWIVPLN